MSSFSAKEKLPKGYRLTERIDLIRSRRQLKTVARLSLALVVPGIVSGVVLMPEMASMFAGGWRMALIRILSLCAAIAAYMAGHEAVHGVLMWLFSRRKPHFGFSLMYAYAGSRAFFGKNAYLLIALAPVIFWGVLLLFLALWLPADWFWVVWGVQITNLSGAAGDFYVFFRLLRRPEHILVQDTGTAMSVYAP